MQEIFTCLKLWVAWKFTFYNLATFSLYNILTRSEVIYAV